MNTNWVAEEGLNIIRFQVESETLSADSDMSNNIREVTLAVGYSLMITVPVNATVKVNGTSYNPGPGGNVPVHVEPGSQVTIEVDELVIMDEGARSSFKGWDDGISDNPRTLTVQGGEILAAEYGIQYFIEIDPTEGEVTGGGWYDENSTVKVEAETPCQIQENVTRLTFAEWTGDIQDTSPIIEFTVNGPTYLEANWKRQYYLSIVSPFSITSGEGWYDEGIAASFTVTNKTIENAGTKATFLGWTGDYTGAQSSAALHIDSPKEVKAVWLIEYLLTVESP
ncbi:MAG: hypothetical protein GTN80_04855, partial [Nitrososphaeria archaeon]|nr:hypothetical protein [Nitrososphaeria archaeon]